MPIDPQTGERLPYPGDPGFQQQGADPGGPPPGMDPGMGGGPPPETLDGPMGPGMPVGISLNPAQMAAIALQAVAEIAGVDLQQFQAGQAAALEQTPAAIAAIMAELKMRAQAPETLDGPAAPSGPAGPAGPEPALNPEDQQGAILA